MIDLPGLFRHWAHGNHVHRWDSPEQAWEPWAIEQGWLRPDKPAKGLRCPDCQAYGKVTSTRNQSGQLVHYLPCEECGSIPIEETLLHQWRWDNNVLLSRLSSLLCPGYQVMELVPEQAWVLGKIALASTRPQLVLFRTANATQHNKVCQWLTTNKSVNALFPCAGLSCDWRGFSFDVANAIRIDEHGLHISDQWLAFLKEIESGTKGAVKVLRRRRSDRVLNIEKISNYLIEFLQRRKDHANNSFHAGQGEQLLPCPTQKEISLATKLNKGIVSKCLHDSRAKGLQAYWKLCQSLDVKDCYRFRAPSVKPSRIVAQQEQIIDEMED